MIEVSETPLGDLLVLEPAVYGDDRGFFLESFNADALRRFAGVEAGFVQDNHSRSRKHVLRGLHYQLPRPQGKLVRVARGRVFDVAVDLRSASPTLGRWHGIELSDDGARAVLTEGASATIIETDSMTTLHAFDVSSHGGIARLSRNGLVAAAGAFECIAYRDSGAGWTEVWNESDPHQWYGTGLAKISPGRVCATPL